ncbi:DUF1491 family protein [Sphingosinicella terrae]|uniref:DUF1491 family protein n=1 Tax=Sphingosinicella terrae TaxID=2172047 RepID=UPI003D7D3546
MTQARLVSSMLVGALLRRAQAEGGFGTVLAKGDPTAGAIGVVLLERGEKPSFFERLLQPDGTYSWQRSTGTDEAEVAAAIERRRRFDPDLWIVELDIASAERFAAEMNLLG